MAEIDERVRERLAPQEAAGEGAALDPDDQPISLD